MTLLREEIKVAVDAAVRAKTNGGGGRPGGRRSLTLPLTKREHAVIAALAKTSGNNAQVAESLGLSEDTLKFHLTRIYAKIGVHNRTSAVAWAFANGVVRAKPRVEIWRRALVKTDETGAILEVVVVA